MKSRDLVYNVTFHIDESVPVYTLFRDLSRVGGNYKTEIIIA